ncbi:MAG: protease-4 [Saprospiraceae bacterium]|jgi:protease-4
MGKFFQFVFASCLGVILASVVVGGIGALVIGKVVSSADAPEKVKANTVLKLDLGSAVPEKTNNVPVDPFSFDTEKKLGLFEMVEIIGKAKDDDKIKGIYLDIDAVPMGRASASTLRDALVDFKSDGKFIVSYSEYYSQGTFYLASISDKIFVNPLGGVDFRGFGAQIPFFKDMLDRLDIKMQVYYAGDFKSATEPYRLDKMSEKNRLQTREYVESMYDLYLMDISEGRKISKQELRKMANEYLLRNAADALDYKMVDAVGYEDEALDEIRNLLGLDKDDKLNTIGLGDYGKGLKSDTDFKIKDKIAIVFAEGTIDMGKGTPGSIGGDKYVEIFRKIRKNDKIKAVVLRVNSGGGSALASDMMWREIKLLKEAGKPVIASMGDVAASGGYYIACPADSVFAELNTITGSIGVFSMIPSIENMLKEKVGVTFDTLTTGKFAVGITPLKNISPEEGIILQESTDEIYETFLARVADGRKMTRDEVHNVAQGRVWTATKAKSIGLVDDIGDLDRAIAAAASLAGLEKYRTTEYPVAKEPIQQMIEQFTGQKTAKAVVEAELMEAIPYYRYLKEINQMEGVQARLPFVFGFK